MTRWLLRIGALLAILALALYSWKSGSREPSGNRHRRNHRTPPANRSPNPTARPWKQSWRKNFDSTHHHRPARTGQRMRYR